MPRTLEFHKTIIENDSVIAVLGAGAAQAKRGDEGALSTK
jgi:hypothetical protein